MPEDCIVPGYLTSRAQVFENRKFLTWQHDAWDDSIYGPKILQDKDGLYRMYYTGYAEGLTEGRVCLAISKDLVTWIKPNLGLHTYGGNTNNNIVFQVAASSISFQDIIIDSESYQTVQYILSTRNDTNGDNYLHTIGETYTSATLSVSDSIINGGSGLANSAPTPPAIEHPNGILEVKSLSWHQPSQKWRRWYTHGQTAQLRSIGYYDSAAITGPWVNRGIHAEFEATANWLQFYDFSHFYYKGSMWAVVNTYNSSNEIVGPLRLYRSEDYGDTWTRSTDLLKSSSAGNWDTGLITEGTPFLVNGIWYLVYGGKIGNHATTTRISPFIATAIENPAGEILQEDKPNTDSIVPGYITSRTQVLERQWRLPFKYDAWDDSVYGPKVVVDPKGGYRMYYTAYAASNYSAGHCIAVATSSDLINWYKPNLGLHSFGGSTANNIVLKVDNVDLQFCDIMVNPHNGEYLLTVRNDTTGGNFIYRSTDGMIFTWISGTNMTGSTGLSIGGAQAHPTAHVESKSLSWNPKHKKWRWWYNHGHFNPTAADSRRSIGYYDASDLAGPWTNRGIHPEFTSTATTLQYYDFSPFYYKGSMWAVVNVYNKTTEMLGPLRLYRSEDHGDTWTRSTDLLGRNFTGTWDAGLITDGCPILVDGVWYFIYAGKTGNHAQTPRITLGMATAIENPAIAQSKKGVGRPVGLNEASRDSIVPNTTSSCRSILTKIGVLTGFPRTATDLYVYSPRVLRDDNGTFFMFYTAYSAPDVYSPAVATSTDLINWTKPIVGQVTFGGNTNNNYIYPQALIQGENAELQDVIFHDGKFVALVQNKVTSVHQLWTSPDGFVWTWLQNSYTSHHTLEGRNNSEELNISVNGFVHSEPKSLLFTNGVYRIYYVTHFTQRRSIGYQEALTLDHMLPRVAGQDGSFTDKGIMGEFRATNQELQYYDICTFHYAGSVWAAVTMYNRTTGVLGPIRLYRSDNGGNSFIWVNNLVNNGNTGTWDAGLMAVGKPILVDGVWTMIYAGSPDHHEVWPRTMEFGYAKGIENLAIANIKKINDVSLIGDGSGIPWGPE